MRVELSKRAGKQFKKIPKPHGEKILEKIRHLESKDTKYEKLIGHKDRYKIRSGNYRIVLKKITNSHVQITAIADRKDIYKKLFDITLSL